MYSIYIGETKTPILKVIFMKIFCRGSKQNQTLRVIFIFLPTICKRACMLALENSLVTGVR